jgi:hypothetical protein
MEHVHPRRELFKRTPSLWQSFIITTSLSRLHQDKLIITWWRRLSTAYVRQYASLKQSRCGYRPGTDLPSPSWVESGKVLRAHVGLLSVPFCAVFGRTEDYLEPEKCKKCRERPEDHSGRRDEATQASRHSGASLWFKSAPQEDFFSSENGLNVITQSRGLCSSSWRKRVSNKWPQ